MSEPNRQDRPASSGPDFLRLAESGEGSTHHLGLPAPSREGAQSSRSEKGDRADRSAAGGSARVDAASGSAAASFFAGDASGESARSGSGFDTLLGKLVIDRGLITSEELDLCRSLLQESSGGDRPRTLSDVLVDNEFLTQRQLARLRTDFEADRTSQKIPGYRILKKLGSGAMATVFLARQLSLDRLVAIKVLPKKFSSNRKFIERFYKEGRAAAKLNDPNIVAAYDVGSAGDHHYFVMEYVDGETVYDRIVQKKRFSEKEALEVIRQVASALQHAHERGFIHRDIKPKNIMLNRAGTVKLADLGLARALSDKEAAEAESGRAYGTPYYISPEQIRGQVDIGPPADIYGLGATFYHMVTGRVPFEGKNPSEVMHRHLKSELAPPDHINARISAGCAQIIEMMMAKDARDRYQNAADLTTDIELVLDGKPPHFAQSKLDLSHVVHELKTAPAVAPSRGDIPRLRNPAAERSLLIVLSATLIVSLAANAGLLIALLVR
ncbi:MAG TPA: serine/threonine-protein kinase [Phycisphaerales bacterium]|nr:serine/threonine-protein kinase [Phycisphaerales bacterium]HMP35946.1 serine/threonine-protein kinase [Phycisphaerales bacterium]